MEEWRSHGGYSIGEWMTRPRAPKCAHGDVAAMAMRNNKVTGIWFFFARTM
jgi:hypothetical protein